MIIKLRLKTQLTSCIVMGIILSCIFSVKLLSRRHNIHFRKSDHSGASHIRPTVVVTKPVQELLEAIKAATWVASGGEDPPGWTQEERAEWEVSHPCRSRSELDLRYARRKRVKDMADNPLWQMVLKEYILLHHTCMQRVGDVRQSFMQRNSTTGCKFAIADIDWSIPAGLSNRILSIISVVLYAILTQRVVLIPRSTLVTTIMCEPFPGSSWDMDEYGPFSWYPWSEEAKDVWAFHKDLYRELDDKMANHTSSYFSSPQSKLFATSMELSQYHPENRFFCDSEQESFKGVTWLYFTGCIYTIPKFFAIRSFRTTLEALFPGRFVLTQMLRSIMLPADSVWDEIVRNDETHFKGPDRRVGVQVRFYYGASEYEKMNGIYNERIMSCAINNGILPALTDSKPRYQQSVQVFVASLYTGFFDHMTNVYLSDPRPPSADVGLIQLSNNSVQLFGEAVDKQSLVEIFLLSFSDVLISTPISTFGGLAQGYGSLIPWKIETRSGENLPPCERDVTVDLCYQTATTTYSCTYNDVNGLAINALVPYFEPCLQGFTQAGLKLLTDYKTATFQDGVGIGAGS